MEKNRTEICRNTLLKSNHIELPMTKTSNRTFRNPISNRRPKRRHAANQSLRYEHLENRMLLACDVSTHNLASPTDVNCDNNTTPIDALLVINALNQDGPRSANDGPEGLAPDVNGDGNISPIDALMVINDLNSEGEDDAMARIRLMVTSTDDSSTAITSMPKLWPPWRAVRRSLSTRRFTPR